MLTYPADGNTGMTLRGVFEGGFDRTDPQRGDRSRATVTAAFESRPE